MTKTKIKEVKFYDFPKTTKFGKKIGGFVKLIVKKVFNLAEHYLKVAFVFFHRKLSELEDYLLVKLAELGEYAEKKLNERIEELTE